MLSPQQSVELFHLNFCRFLDQNLEKGLYSIKGGCNLRFNYQSIRYSEDLDIDVKTVAVKTLENKVDKILRSGPLLQALKQKGIEIVQSTKPKQTETVQRWKVQIQIGSLTLPTKIEFSRRGLDQEVIYGPVSAQLISDYKLFPILCSYYGLETATEQKVKALIYRSETQARDLFDLDLLLKKKPKRKMKATRQEKETALENAMSVSFPDFQGQVVSYLMPEYQDYYANKKVWENLKQTLLEYLATL
ncbi:MAG: nucleotidyl transferase AbiEii/AbiGii toxin family protein [Bdellovibrionales bacterium]